VAAVAAELDEELLAPADDLRALEPLHAGVALDAERLHLLAAVERVLLELERLDVPVLVLAVAVGPVGAVHVRALALVAGRAAELLGRVLAEQQVAPGVRLPRVRLVVEPHLVDARVARRAAVDAVDRLVEVVAVEAGEHDLLDLRDLRPPVEAEEGRRRLRARVVADGDGLEALPEPVACRGELRQRVLGRPDRGVHRFDVVLELLDVLLRLAVDLLALGPDRLTLVDPALDLVGRASVVERVVVEEPPLLELALHEAEVQVLALVGEPGPAELRLEPREPAGLLARGDAAPGLLEDLRRLLVGGVGVEPPLLVRDRLLEAPDLQAVERRLVLLPGTAEDVVVDDRPQRADEEEQRADEPDRPVGALLVVEYGFATAGHLPPQLLGSMSRPTPKRARPLSARYSSFHRSPCVSPR
jgi:hypothetical protein